MLTESDIAHFASARILVVGDVMLDHFVWGNVRRISPEAPVPVVEVVRETLFPGGAANVARNLAEFTQHGLILGRVGADSDAQKLTELMKEEGVGTELLLIHPTLPTISKTRIAARQQQIVRVDREVIQKLGADELDEVERRVREKLPEIDAIIIEDYGKGFVTQELVDTLVRLASSAGKLLTVDPSPRNPLQWKGASLVKPNRLEAFAAAGMEDTGKDGQLKEVGKRLLDKWQVPNVLVTLGEQGMMIFDKDSPETPHHLPTRAREVYDVSGAGDTAIALLTLALSSGMSLHDAAEVANHASGIVVGKLGTATLKPAELLAAFQP
ncbi:MAG: D-glycero-beta-D-manno-heptose-7-phosphate kinase [Verrucomicrobiaceae bacterium]|nr:D-glycero-beta-D-manno-heptose-7-phosphate kinase [Verrucomicrobiaceae bacterium]